MSPKKLWFYPLLFGVIGTFIGLLLRFVYTGSISNFPYKNVLHAHSHVMLLGFLFNALLVLIWLRFVNEMDKLSFRYYILLQVCMTLMIITFVIQGYAFFSILLSTLHLILSYILLIRLWKRLKGNKELISLIKVGIVFHFISSLGPFSLGPLMINNMQDSPWYQQAVFFYLHFQFFGLYFTWMLALLFQQAEIKLSKLKLVAITLSLPLLYVHSLDYSFDHWIIQLVGGLGSILLFVLILSFISFFRVLKRSLQLVYFTILLVGLANVAGTIPQVANLVVYNRFVLIAWLHFLFLGVYVPFIWVFLKHKIPVFIWLTYIFSVILSELILVFYNLISQWISISAMWVLFGSYLILFITFSFVHFKYIFDGMSKDDLLKGIMQIRK